MEWFKTVCFDIEIFLKNEMKNDSIFGNVKPINAYLTRHIIFMAGCMNALFLLSLVMYGSTREFTVFVNLHVTIQLQLFEYESTIVTSKLLHNGVRFGNESIC